MTSGILPPELKSIEQLFTGNAKFEVPKYQRSFAWGTDETRELWEDIASGVERGNDYFLGTIVLHKREDDRMEIIDGQQRLACMSMVLSAVRNYFLSRQDDRAHQIDQSFLAARDYSSDSQPKPKLELNSINNECFISSVVASEDAESVQRRLRTKGLVKSNRLLLEAFLYFTQEVANKASSKGTRADDFIVPLIEYIRSKVKLITIVVHSEEDANLVFESLNARGKELAVSDLVKNRLYHESGDQLKRAQQLWEQMEVALARLSVPEYIRHFWIARQIDDGSTNVREKHLYGLVVNTVRGNKGRTMQLMQELKGCAESYAGIGDLSAWPVDPAYGEDFENAINELRLFRVTQCHPILLNAMTEFKKPKEIAKVFRIVANFSFRYFIIGNQSPGSLERESGKIACQMRHGTYSSATQVADAFRAVNSDPRFRQDFELAAMDKRRAKLARYTLAKLNNYTSRKNGDEQTVNPDSKQVTLEHILPQSFSPEWRRSFPTGTDAADFVYRLGNLTLLSRKKNDDAGNQSFSEKRKVLRLSKLPISAGIVDEKQWTNQEIEVRQKQLAKLALDVWRL
jgi:hypothetical protein